PIRNQGNTEIQEPVKKEEGTTQNAGNESLKIGAINKIPKRASLDVLVALFITDLILYWVISIVNNEFATVFFWFVMIYIGIPCYLVDYIKTQRVSYVVERDKITINKGVIVKNSNTINFNLITNVAIRRNVFARATGLSNVFLITANAFAGGILILNRENAEWLKNYILNNRTKS
ncbi:MAG: PH domain-containing protein, partial [Candidatus Omnitrophota bacterium]